MHFKKFRKFWSHFFSDTKKSLKFLRTSPWLNKHFILCFNFNSAESTRQSGKEVFMDKIIQEAANNWRKYKTCKYFGFTLIA